MLTTTAMRLPETKDAELLRIELTRLHSKMESLDRRLSELQAVLYDYQHTRQSAAAHQERLAQSENDGQLVLQRYCRKADVDKS